ncbi:MAG: isoprenyl transferase [Phycisphaerales bacterium]|nr:isoprenyl transferase [Phycisphaerales bacterium]
MSAPEPMADRFPREALPRHVAVIMDGNGRWAQQRGRPRLEGHQHAARAVRETISHCARLGIQCLTLYAFSVENWKRPRVEVDGLMQLYARSLAAERNELHRQNVRIVHIGRLSDLPPDVQRELADSRAMTANNTGLTLCIALNYGARAEIVDAARALAERVRDGTLRPDEIDEARLAAELYTAGLPDPDLIIRTAGEMRLSNFLLWQASYAEFHATPVLFPDFGAANIDEAIRSFVARERRFGDVPGRTAHTAPQTGA